MEIFLLISIKTYRKSMVPICKYGIQTVGNQISQCKRLKNERKILKSGAFTAGKWPVSKSELTNGNLKQFITYIKSMTFPYIKFYVNHFSE
jgi:hypothetical protein